MEPEENFVRHELTEGKSVLFCFVEEKKPAKSHLDSGFNLSVWSPKGMSL